MFYFRDEEINKLNTELNGNNKRILIYGKRRVGKTSLIKKILEQRENSIYFECIQDTLESNLVYFTELISNIIEIPSYISFKSFLQLFQYINSLNIKYTVIFDEYPYLKKVNDKKMVDSLFQSIFDNCPNINFIICGSEISMMNELLEDGNPLFGRIGTKIYLDELNYSEASVFYNNKSLMDKIAFYSVFGGSPYINSFIDKNISLEDNIKKLLLNESSPVYNYAEYLLISDAVNVLQAKKIISYIANGKKKYSDIEAHVDLDRTGKIAKALKSLVELKLLKKTYPINKLDNSKKAYYELNDNVLRFYYTFVYGKNSIIVNIGVDNFYDTYVKDKLNTFISHRFENIVRNYYSILSHRGLIKGIRNIGTYYYDDSKTKSNGEFDVALEFEDYIKIIEVKYYKNELKLNEMKNEIIQIQNIKLDKEIKYAFISTSGYEDNDFECIDPNLLYEI